MSFSVCLWFPDNFDPVLIADKLRSVADALNEDMIFKSVLTDMKKAAAQEVHTHGKCFTLRGLLYHIYNLKKCLIIQSGIKIPSCILYLGSYRF